MECSCANWVITGKSRKFTTQALFHSSVWFNLLSFSYLVFSNNNKIYFKHISWYWTNDMSVDDYCFVIWNVFQSTQYILSPSLSHTLGGPTLLGALRCQDLAGEQNDSNPGLYYRQLLYLKQSLI